MPVYATRKLRNLAAGLMLASGLTHVGQLWFVALDGEVLVGALLGMFYLLISLGLSGQSRFSLWIAVVLPTMGVYLGLQSLAQTIASPLEWWHLLADSAVAISCAYILVKTRHVVMD